MTEKGKNWRSKKQKSNSWQPAEFRTASLTILVHAFQSDLYGKMILFWGWRTNASLDNIQLNQKAHALHNKRYHHRTANDLGHICFSFHFTPLNYKHKKMDANKLVISSYTREMVPLRFNPYVSLSLLTNCNILFYGHQNVCDTKYDSYLYG